MKSVFDWSGFEARVALVGDRGDNYTYGDLTSICRDIGASFCPKKKRLVFIVAKNNIETIVGYLSVIQSGNVAMLIEGGINECMLKSLIDSYSPDYVWKPRGDSSKKCYMFGMYELVEFDLSAESKLHPDLAVLLSTSGSTGSPKQVKLTSNNVITNARSIASYLNLTETERAIVNLPVQYTYGLSIINSHLLVGATLLVTNTPIVKGAFWDFFKSEKSTSLAGVPFVYEMLKRIGFFEMDLPSLRYMTQAGGKMDPRLIKEYAELSRKKKFDFFVMYGATEATARMSFLPPEYNISKAGSIGREIPQGRLHLLSDFGEFITEPNVEGELVYQGPNVMMGYAGCREDLSSNDELHGVLKTGDLAFFDGDGFYYVTGRKSRFLKILGKRISLSEVEVFLERLIGESFFCGGTDDMLLVANASDAFEKDLDLSRTIRRSISSTYGIPVDLIGCFKIEGVPRSSSGKINYSEIFASGRLEGGYERELESEGAV